MDELRVVLRWVGNNGRRIAVTVAGVLLLVVGLALLVLPGPGLLTVAAGLAVLGSEYAWARRVLRRTSEHARRLRWRGKRAGTSGRKSNPYG